MVQRKRSQGSVFGKKRDRKGKEMKNKTKKSAMPEIVCGNLNNIDEASRELDPTMKVIWTSVGFWACPKG